MKDSTIYKKTSNGPSFLDSGTRETPGEAQMKPAPQRLQDHTCFQREQCYIFVLPKVLQCPFVLLGLQRRLHCQNGQCPGRTFAESPRRESDENNLPAVALSTQNPPAALQPEFLREAPPSDNSAPSEAPAPVREDDMTSVSITEPCGQSLAQ